MIKGENMPNLTNSASVEGVIDDMPINLTSNLVTTMIVDGLTITKSADKDFWAGGELLYTIVVTNNSGNKLSSGEITDMLDTSMVALDGNYGVKLNETDTSNYKYDNGILTISLPELEDGMSATIKFQVIQNHSIS